MTDEQLRCDECGRFVGFTDLDAGLAVHKLISHDTEYSGETYVTYCRIHRELSHD